MGARTCACGCGSALPPDAHPRAKYLNPTHRKRMETRRRRDRMRSPERKRRIDGKPVEDQSLSFKGRDESKDRRGSARRGPGYEAFRKTKYPELILTGEVRVGDAAEFLETSHATVSRWMAAYVEDKALGVARDNHEPDLSHTDDLGAFTQRYFPDLLVPDFHKEWEKDIDEVVGTGGRLLLLAPQRFGKTEMLTRYCMKRIAQDPNISIGWVSKTQGLAEKMVGFIKANLERNETFIADVLGPGGTFMQPARGGESWTSSEFTVSNRTKVRKSPTMVALGTGGTILGRDFDLIILDDPQDRTRCQSPKFRETDSEWFFTDFLSRKEEHTGVAFIMSRQHLDDLPGQIIRDHGDDWTIRVYRAHDPACTIPEDKVDEHTECVLWPEKRTWSWLYQQKQANEAHFERNYMNNPKTDNTVLVTAADLDRCKDHSRGLGEMPPDTQHVIAGIDPATAKPTAAVLFAFDGEKRHVLDYMEADPGVRGIQQIIRKWHKGYACSRFILESNMGKWAWDDTTVRDLLNQTGAQLIPHGTYSNKTHHSGGVLAMFAKLRQADPDITFPFKDREAQRKMDRLFRALLMYDPEGGKHADDDLPMAMWFCQPFMDRWMSTQVERALVDYTQTPYAWQTAYPSGSNRHLRAVRGVA